MSDDAPPEADCVDGAPHPRMAPRILGQEAALTAFLSSLAQGRLHHAWLVTGPSGIGKATLAWHLAKVLLSQRDARDTQGSQDVEPGEPDTGILRRVAALSEPGLFLLRRGLDERRKTLRAVITVDDVRALKDFFALSRPDGGWRVVIVDSADDMNIAASNALLKILEEPPKQTVFFLVSAHPGRLLPTIRSRCRTLPCQPLTDTHLSEVLRKTPLEKPMTADDIAAIIPLANGSAGTAIGLHMQGGADLNAQIARLFAEMPGLDRVSARTLCSALAGRDQEPRRDLFLSIVADHLAALAKAGAGCAEEDATGNRYNRYKTLSPDLEAGRQWAAAQTELIASAQRALALNLDPQAVFLDLLVQIDAVAGRCAAR